MEVFLRRTLQGGLVPDDDEGVALLGKIKAGEVVRCKVVRPRDQRSVQQHRLYFALCKLVNENTEGKFESVDEVSEFLKIQAGHYTTRHIKVPVEDEMVTMAWLQPKSISFEKMGHDEFQAYFDKCLDVITQRIIPGIDRAEMEAEVWNMIGGTP